MNNTSDNDSVGLPAAPQLLQQDVELLETIAGLLERSAENLEPAVTHLARTAMDPRIADDETDYEVQAILLDRVGRSISRIAGSLGTIAVPFRSSDFIDSAIDEEQIDKSTDVEVVTEVETPQDDIELTTLEDTLLAFAQENEEFRTEDLRKKIPEIIDYGEDEYYDFKLEVFPEIRRRLLLYLEKNGKQAKWIESGKARGKKYQLSLDTASISDGEDVINEQDNTPTKVTENTEAPTTDEEVSSKPINDNTESKELSYIEGRMVNHPLVRLAVLKVLGDQEIGSEISRSDVLVDPILIRLADDGYKGKKYNPKAWIAEALETLEDEGFLDHNGKKRGGSRHVVTAATIEAYREYFGENLETATTTSETMLPVEPKVQSGAIVRELIIRRDSPRISRNEDKHKLEKIEKFANHLKQWTISILESNGGKMKRSEVIRIALETLSDHDPTKKVNKEQLKRAISHIIDGESLFKGNPDSGMATLTLFQEERTQATENPSDNKKETLSFGPEHVDFAVALVDFIDSERHLERGIMQKELLKFARTEQGIDNEVLTKLVLRSLGKVGLIKWEKDARTSKSPKSKDLRTVRYYMNLKTARERWRNSRDIEVEKIIDLSLTDS